MYAIPKYPARIRIFNGRYRKGMGVSLEKMISKIAYAELNACIEIADQPKRGI